MGALSTLSMKYAKRMVTKSNPCKKKERKSLTKGTRASFYGLHRPIKKKYLRLGLLHCVAVLREIMLQPET